MTAIQARQATPVHPTRATASTMLWSWLVTLPWYAGIVVVLIAAQAVIASRTGSDGQIMQGAAYGARWYAFSVAIGLAMMLIEPSIAHGVTRRELWLGVTTAVLIAAVALTVVVMAGFYAEGLVADVIGYDRGQDYLPPLADPFASPLVAAAGYAVTYAVHLTSGVLVAVVYYRVGGWYGTLLLPLTVGLPLSVPQAALGTDWGPPLLSWLGLDWTPAVAWTLVVCAATAAATTAAHYLVVRAMPVKPVSG